MPGGGDLQLGGAVGACVEVGVGLGLEVNGVVGAEVKIWAGRDYSGFTEPVQWHQCVTGGGSGEWHGWNVLFALSGNLSG